MLASVMVFTVTIFCIPQLQYCQENHVRMAHFDTSHLESELSTSHLSADTQEKILHPFSDMEVCNLALKVTTPQVVAGIAALPGSKFISRYCAYEAPAVSYALIRHYDGGVERKIIPGVE